MGAATVLRWRQEGRPRAQVLRALWQQVGERRWAGAATARVVVRVGQGWRTPLVVETAGSLATALAEQLPGVEVSVVDVPLADVRIDRTVQVAGIAAPRLTVPMDWFDSFFSVTVAGIGPDPSDRLHGVLAAQAEPLRTLGNAVAPEALTYEAHRLAASDLVVACGCADPGNVASEAWWVVSPSDVGAEIAIARACGLTPERLPALRVLAAHELLPALEEAGEPLPRLTGVVAPAFPAHVRTALTRMTASGRAIRDDLWTIRANLGKVPNFVRRKLAARRGKAA